MRKYYILILLVTSIVYCSNAQVEEFEDVEKVAGKGFFKEYVKGLFSDFTDFGEPFMMSGGLGLNARTYNAWGTENRQPPFYWILNGSLNLSIYKLNIPISALISINRRELTLPNPQNPLVPLKQKFTNRFNRVGASPYYKWVKLHAGHRNMTFSQFTLSNLIYLGGGIELTPGNVRFAAMYGQLAKAEPLDLSLLEPNLPVFQRKGWGVKLGYGSSDQFIDLMLFKAWDDPNSIPTPNPQEVFINENMVVGIKAQKTFFETIRLAVDFGSSALSPDATDIKTNDSKLLHPGFLFDARANTEYTTAIETSADYQGQGYSLGLKYRRIDPKYRSLGAYFFNDDIEDIAANASFSLFNQSVQVSTSAGLQKDNLDNAKPSTLSRFIGSANLDYSKDNYSLGLNYSNYSSDIEFVLNPELDSLNVVVVTQDLGFNANYTLSGTGENRHTFTFAANAQVVTDDIDNPQESAESNMYNFNLIYAFTVGDGWNINTNGNYNTNMLSMMEVSRWGFGGGVSKNFMEGKLNLGLNLNYFRASVSSLADITNNTLNTKFRGTYRITDNQSLNVNFNLMRSQKDDNMGSTDSFTEGIGNIGYQFNFSYNPRKGKEEVDESN